MAEVSRRVCDTCVTGPGELCCHTAAAQVSRIRPALSAAGQHICSTGCMGLESVE